MRWSSAASIIAQGRCLHELVGGLAEAQSSKRPGTGPLTDLRPHHDDYWPGAEFFVVSDAPFRTLFYPEGC